LERELLKYETVRKFLADLKKEFEGGNEETVKVAELKRCQDYKK